MKSWLSRWTMIPAGCLLMAAGLAPVANAQATAALVQVGTTSKLGNVLVNGQGMTLYTLSSEVGGTIKCSGGCLGFWPPLMVPAGTAAPTSAPGATGTFATLTRPEGTQVTYNGFPLYMFANDKVPGDTNGDGIVAFGGTWHVVQISGVPLSATPVERLTIRITTSGAKVWGQVTASYDLNGKLVQRSCAQSACRLPVPLGARVLLTQSPTNLSSSSFAAWKIKAVPGKASARVVKRPTTSFHMNKVYTVTAVYVAASAGSGYGS